MKWDLRTKLSASLSVAMALLCLEAAVSQWAIVRVRGAIERVAQQSPIARYARDLTESAAAEASVVGTYVDLHDMALLNGRSADQERERLALARLDEVAAMRPYLATLIHELKLQLANLRQQFPNEIAAADAHHPALASWMVLRTQDKIAMMRLTSDGIGDAVTSDMLAASLEYQGTSRQAAAYTLLTIIASLSLFGIIAGTFASSMSRRLGEVSRKLGELADELQSTDPNAPHAGEQLGNIRWKPIDERGSDEISEVARGSNHLVSRLVAAGQSLYDHQQRLKATLSSITDAVIRTRPNGLVDYVNPAAAAMLGCEAGEARMRYLHEFFTLEIGEAVEADPVSRCLEARETILVHDDQARLRFTDGRVMDVFCALSPLFGPDGVPRGVVLTVRDVTEARALAAQLRYQATHDALTGLFNRRQLERDLEEALRSAQHDQRTHALLYLDLDQFKVINDTCGHTAGDELLCRLSTILTVRVGAKNTLARIGGDEFALLLRDLSLQEAEAHANEIREAVAKSSFSWGEHAFPMSASIGVVPVTATSTSVAATLSAVDAACYAAKDGGRNRVHSYAEQDSELARTFGEMNWVSRINRALADSRFRIFQQPIRALGEHESDFRHVELLLRMVDEHGRLVTPFEFLPAAERYNLMTTIDRWVVIHALPICARLIEQGVLDLCSINLSGASLKSETLGPFLQHRIATSGIDPRSLCFEITETVAVTNASRVATLMQELHTLGCRFALDDFGSGMSSFGLLKRLPVDYLKIDGSFVRGIADDATDFAMVEAINRVGHVMGIKTVAEYVSTSAIAERLVAIGVDYGQGYALGRPEPLTDLFSTSRREKRLMPVIRGESPTHAHGGLRAG
jgi:diguanylate cyclase (GGDEF)-like protein/PAS domain S-box-containing protein